MDATPSLMSVSTTVDTALDDAPPTWTRSVGSVVGTLPAVLAWMGHRCRDMCPEESSSLETPTWIVPRQRLVGAVGLVVIDIAERPEPLCDLFALLRAVNMCTRVDRIRVLPGNTRRRAILDGRTEAPPQIHV